MANQGYTRVKAICHMNSRMIFKMVLQGKQVQDIVEALLQVSKLSSSHHIARGFSKWRIDLNFKNFQEMRDYIVKYGVPIGSKPITLLMLDQHKNQPIHHVDVSPSVPTKVNNNIAPLVEDKKTDQLIVKPIARSSSSYAQQEETTFKKNRAVKSISARTREIKLNQNTEE